MNRAETLNELRIAGLRGSVLEMDCDATARDETEETTSWALLGSYKGVRVRVCIPPSRKLVRLIGCRIRFIPAALDAARNTVIGRMAPE